MSWWEALILGIVQGLTEFLPISSSAHLLILPWLFQWTPGGLAFDALLHGGTLMALVVYFREDLTRLSRQSAAWLGGGAGGGSAPRPLLLLALGTLPVVLAGAAGRNLIEHWLRAPAVAVSNLIVFGLLLAWADRRGSGARRWEDLGLWEGLLIGSAQALALAPGVSRAGITITAALLLGLGRVQAARFAFLLGVPAIAAATAAASLDWWAQAGSESAAAGPLLLGVTSAFGSGFLCIKYFLRFLQKGSLLWFAAYRCGLAVLAAYLLL